MPYDKATEGCPAMQYTTVAEPDAGAHAIYTEMLSNYKALEDVSTSPADGTTPQATYLPCCFPRKTFQVWFAIHWSAFSSSFSYDPCGFDPHPFRKLSRKAAGLYYLEYLTPAPCLTKPNRQTETILSPRLKSPPVLGI